MKITKEEKEFIEKKKNVFCASDWFDENFFGRFLYSNHPIKKHFNAQTYSISEENISSRVLNHWYEMGIIDDDRLNGKGWKRLSMSEIVWIHIINKLRGFGLDLKRIKEVKNQIDLYSSKDNISKSPLLDFYMAVAITSSIPIKLIVFESGQAEIVRQMEIDTGNEFGWITEDFISIDINDESEFVLDNLNSLGFDINNHPPALILSSQNNQIHSFNFDPNVSLNKDTISSWLESFFKGELIGSSLNMRASDNR